MNPAAVRIRALALLAAALAPLGAAGCGPKFVRVPLAQCPVQTLPKPSDEKVRVQYLGVGGFLLKRGDDVLVTAPLYTAPGILEMFLSRELRPNADLVNQLYPQDGDAAQAILVGHSHYDHLMDVPYLALNRARSADIYGSRNTARMLAPIVAQLQAKTPPTKIVPLDLVAGDDQHPGTWQTVGSGIRFMALRTEHAPFFTLKLNPPLQKGIELPFYLLRGGGLTEDATELPKSIVDYVQGPVFKFIIDFLDGGRPVYRIYYEDTGTSTGVRTLPAETLAEKPIDLAILALDGDAQAMSGKPAEDILQVIRPKAVIVGHWEDFFFSQDIARLTGEFHQIPSASLFQAIDLQGMLKRLQASLKPAKTPYYVPCPTRSIFEFPIE
jgi:L-ascorbate metabolism protein UlaG (beta-lactamase superfamily)